MDKMRQDKKEEEELGEEEMVEMMAAMMMTGTINARRERRPQASEEVIAAAREGDLAKLQQLVEGGPSLDKEEALRESARMGRLEVVRYLINQYEVCVDAKEVDYPNTTALILAATNGHLDVVQCLAEQGGAAVDVDDKEERTALMHAVINGRTDVVQYLVEQCGADLRAESRDADTALMLAAGDGHIDIVQYLAGRSTIGATAKNSNGSTPFQRAAERGHVGVMQYLVKQYGADADSRDNDGYTPLMRTAEYGQVDAVQYLAGECGADVNAKSENGYTALMRAARSGCIDVVRYLTEQCGADTNDKNNAGKTALMKAAKHGHQDVVRYLAGQCGSDVNAKDNNGYSALMRAARYGQIDIVQYLTGQHGANVNIKTNDGYTALMLAAEKDYMDIVEYLAGQCGANVNAKVINGDSALMRAARSDRINLVKYLVDECGADVCDKDNAGTSALMQAAGKGHVDIVQYLARQCVADVNAKDNDGYTALMWAARYGCMGAAQYIVEQCGADVNNASNNGETALMLAARYGHIVCVHYFAHQRGVDVNARDGDGYTALMKAAKTGRFEVVQYLVEQCDADVNVKSKDGTNATKLAADGGYYAIEQILRPFLSLADKPCVDDARTLVNGVLSLSDHQLRCSIPPSEIELTVFSENANIGGDFQAKWLDADAVVKLFIPDASRSSFDDEVRLWKRLRHPNVLKMYGACYADSQIQFFVCEYASQGSLWEYVKLFSENDSFEDTIPPHLWKYLYEAALGLEYLHERGIVHGDLRCSNILIGSDGMAKLSNFALSGRTDQFSSDVFRGTMAWQAPEILRGEPPSYKSDVYSLAMCIMEAGEADSPWLVDVGDDEDYKETRAMKLCWAPENEVEYGEDSRSDPDTDLNYDIAFLSAMCSQDPHKRACLPSIVHELERLVAKESATASQPELEPATSFGDYECGKLTEAWVKLETNMEKCGNVEYRRAFGELKIVHERLQKAIHHPTLFARFDTLLTEFYQTVKMSPEQARMMRLSSSRVTTSSMYAFQWRIKSLQASLGESVDCFAKTEAGWQQQISEQIQRFVSGVSDIFLLLNDLNSTEERAVFLRMLKAEMENPSDKYTPDQLEVMANAFEDIASRVKGDDLSELTPEWFIPWYELIVDEWGILGEGSYGSVNRAKWLDSDVVVKQVILAGGSRSGTSSYTLDLSESYSSAWEDPSASQAQIDATKRAEALMMFRREVDIWFGFSHPHVVRLFGACHVGRPFFVCEYATNGTLVSYLRKHPDEIWAKLHEATLGVQYLHARDVVHGDLKGNNIVIGSDMKAKVTDFGLSSVASSGSKAQTISGAWQWVAPELLGTDQHPTFASDMYSLGMCVVEALRVVEAGKSGKDSRHCLPWRVGDQSAVKYHATRGTLPSRPSMCEDRQWELVKKMCALDPQKRIKISTVVDELAKLANVSDSGQPNDLGDTLLQDSVNWESVGKVIATLQRQLSPPQDSGNQRDQVLSLHVSLWKNLERVHNHIDGDSSNECRAAFCSLVSDANDATVKLRDMDKNLVSVAQTTMRCHALERSLSKLCDAYFIVIDGKPVVNEMNIVQGKRETLAGGCT